MTYDKSPNAKALIFDLDGTLADTMPYHYKAWKASAQTHGMDMSKDFLRSLMGSSAKRIATQLCENHGITKNMPIDSILESKSQNYLKLLPKVTVINEVFDIAKKYHGKLPMAIGTGGSRRTITETLNQTGIGNYFDVIIAADDVTNHKPAPDTFLECAKLLGVNPRDCEVFEDGDPGLEAAIAGGMIATDIRNWVNPTW